MKSLLFASALAIGTMAVTAAGAADRSRDAEMTAQARAQDSAATKRLNEGQLAQSSERDAKAMQAYRQAQKEGATAYEAARTDYERDMAAWRRAVAACRAGKTEYCAK